MKENLLRNLCPKYFLVFAVTYIRHHFCIWMRIFIFNVFANSLGIECFHLVLIKDFTFVMQLRFLLREHHHNFIHDSSLIKQIHFKLICFCFCYLDLRIVLDDNGAFVSENSHSVHTITGLLPLPSVQLKAAGQEK